MPTRFTDEQRREMLAGVQEREGRWDEVDPNTEVASIGEGAGLGEEESYELFKLLMDEGYVDPGRVLGAGGAMPGHTFRAVGHGNNVTGIGDDVRLTDKGRAEVG